MLAPLRVHMNRMFCGEISSPRRDLSILRVLNGFAFLLVASQLALAAVGSHAVVVVPVANMYSSASDNVDVVSQAILGTNVEVLEQSSGWDKVRTNDQYIGWIRQEEVRELEAGASGYAASGAVAQVRSLSANLYRETDVTLHRPVLRVPFETRLEVVKQGEGNEARWLEVQLPDRRSTWIQSGDVDLAPRKLSIEESIALGRRFLGVTYTWGGAVNLRVRLLRVYPNADTEPWNYHAARCRLTGSVDGRRGDQSQKITCRGFALFRRFAQSHHAYRHVYRPRAVHTRYCSRSSWSTNQPIERPALDAAACGMQENQMNWLTCLACCTSICLVMAQPGFAENLPQEQKIDAILTSAGLKAGIPGAAVIVIKDDKPVFERGYGVKDLSTLEKIDARTNFRLASVTKQFTAMAVMLLVHDGKLRYDERLTDIFPDFPEYGRAITLRMLLNHTSGLQDYEDLMTQPDPSRPVEQTQIQDAGVLDLLKKQNSTKFTPGSKWQYSNSGYVLLGLIVQKVSVQSFPEFLHDRIFSPAGMNNAVAYVRGINQVPNRAYGNSFENGAWKQTDQDSTSATLGDGGVYSSIEDMTKWEHALRHNTLLSRDEMQAALTPVDVPGVEGPDGMPAQYGFGWFLNPYKGHARMWHYGETVGFRTTIQRFTNDGLTVIMLCNRADLNPSALALHIADLYLDGNRE